LTRSPNREKTARKWLWTLRVQEESLAGRIGFSAESTAFRRVFQDRDYTSGDLAFDDAVRLTGTPDILRVSLSHAIRRTIAQWAVRGGSLIDGVLTMDFRAGPYANAVLRRTRVGAGLVRRLRQATDTDIDRLFQIAVHDTDPEVRVGVLKHVLSLTGGPLSRAPDVSWDRRPSLLQALTAAAHSDHAALTELAGVHLAPFFEAEGCSHWSESMLIAAAEHGRQKEMWAELVAQMGRSGGQRSLDYLVDYAESWFGLRKGAKHAEAAITELMNRLGGDRSGGLSVVEPLATGAVSLIAPLESEEEDEEWD